MITLIPVLAFIFLMSASALSALETALQQLGRLQAEENLKKGKSPFFFKGALTFFFGRHLWEGLLFSLSFTKHLIRIFFITTAFFFIIDTQFFFVKIAFIIALSLLCDFLFCLVGQFKPRFTFGLLAAPSSIILFLCTPITAPFFSGVKILLT